jgi:hypothetical protein
MYGVILLIIHLLSGVSTCNDCTTNCCGDNKLDFDNLMTQPLSNILTVEDFNHYLISELMMLNQDKHFLGIQHLERYMIGI